MNKLDSNMTSYVDMLMQNNPFENNSSDEYSKVNKNLTIEQHGGDIEQKTKNIKKFATGSFPPIYIVTKEELEKELDKGRGFAKPNKTAVSIKVILQERRDDIDKKPFIML